MAQDNGGGGGGNEAPAGLQQLDNVPPQWPDVENLLPEIASYLSWNELNVTFSHVAPEWRTTRNLPFLDQTREIIITFGETDEEYPTTDRDFTRLAQVASSPGRQNFTHMKIHGIQNLPRNLGWALWPNITHISIQQPGTEKGGICGLANFLGRFNNLQSLDVNGMVLAPNTTANVHSTFLEGRGLQLGSPWFDTLTSLSWHNCSSDQGIHYGLYFDGRDFFRLSMLQELDIDGTHLRSGYPNHEFLSRIANQLHKVSCVGVRDVSKVKLMKFVRDAPKLKWFRSDLNQADIAVLQLQRPDVTFVTP